MGSSREVRVKAVEATRTPQALRRHYLDVQGGGQACSRKRKKLTASFFDGLRENREDALLTDSERELRVELRIESAQLAARCGRPGPSEPAASKR
jgi:hypothetical protein